MRWQWKWQGVLWLAMLAAQAGQGLQAQPAPLASGPALQQGNDANRHWQGASRASAERKRQLRQQRANQPPQRQAGSARRSGRQKNQQACDMARRSLRIQQDNARPDKDRLQRLRQEVRRYC
ncbi:hypothetical protein EBQ34_08225 [Vandammella animalimorsus]|uniref:Uncharacterized protein n=1 Tax=Vandammella animalimorsus TaxID=2029117 RepID=A0A3M6RJ53_9BURK|nr:hypothetical protein [Vandammella animalimorsus]RMX14888.1 hypothetical protein EBQ34_08225 [Vandammella animalimorsus]